ncbi:MAG: PspC domain-containing protein [Microthrixaceae bacterium]
MERPTLETPAPQSGRLTPTRSTIDRHLGGVGPAVAEYLGVSVAVARLGLAISVLLGGLGLVLYVALWLVVPDDQGRVLIRGQVPDAREITLAAVFAGLAALPLTAWVTQEGPSWIVSFLVVVGVFVLGRRSGPQAGADAAPFGGPVSTPPPPPMPPTPPTPPPPPMPPTPPTPPPVPPSPLVDPVDPEPVDRVVSVDQLGPPVPDAPAALAPVLPPEEYGTAAFPRVLPPRSAVLAPERPAKQPKPAPFLGPLTVSIAIAMAGSLSLLHALGAIELRPSDVLIAVLVVIGLGLLVSTWFGRARGLVVLGLLLVPVVLASAVIDRIDLRGGYGDRTYTPTTTEELHAEHRLGVGALRLDLTELEPDGAGVAPVRLASSLSLGVGEVQVVVPESWSIDLVAEVEAGWVRLHDGGQLVAPAAPLPSGSGELHADLAERGEDFWFPDSQDVRATPDGPDGTRHRIRVDGEEGAPHLSLDVDVIAGVVEVFRVQS